MSFEQLSLIEPLIEALNESGYTEPTPIQSKAIPVILEGSDIMASAQTGTGKTAGFVLPILQKLSANFNEEHTSPRALIIAPTRELAIQIGESIECYSRFLLVRSTVVFGGVKIGPQIKRLQSGADILVATPGRLIDLFQQQACSLDNIDFLVLDEADRMLDMGFLPDVKKIMTYLPLQRQTLLFSATFSPEIKKLCHTLLKSPVSVSVSTENTTAKTVTQYAHPVDKKAKSALLSYLIGKNQWQQVLVFTRTKRGANKVAYDLSKAGINAEAIHGDKGQGTRTRLLKAFKSQQLQALIATDIAARGLDIDQLPQVINFDLPNVAEDYVHRIGRTGRAGVKGTAISLISADESEHLFKIERLIRQKLPRQFVDGFIPEHTVPDLHNRTKKKPPKKKKTQQKKPRNKKSVKPKPRK